MSEQRALLCGVCAAAPHRYRCPACRAQYCSVRCYAAHAPACAPPPAPPAAAPPAPQAPDSDTDGGDGDEDELGARLPPARLARLAADAPLRAALRDPRLQAVLRAIDEARDRGAALAAARRVHGAPFCALLDDILVAVGVADRAAGGDDTAPITYIGLPRRDAREAHAAAAAAAAAALAAAAAVSLPASAPVGAVYGDDDDVSDANNANGVDGDRSLDFDFAQSEDDGGAA